MNESLGLSKIQTVYHFNRFSISSSPNRKMTCSQPEQLSHEIKDLKTLLVGRSTFFGLVLKMWTNCKKDPNLEYLANVVTWCCDSGDNLKGFRAALGDTDTIYLVQVFFINFHMCHCLSFSLIIVIKTTSVIDFST